MPEDIPILNSDWEPPIEDWGKVDDDVYKFTFKQAKKSVNESISISEEIMNKSQKLMIAFASFIAAAFSASFKISVTGILAFVAIIF